MKGDKGSVTVFTAMFLVVFLGFVFFMLELICWKLCDMKAAEAVKQNAKGLFGDFDAEIFEDYHLLMLDATYGTDNDIYLEERLASQLSYNLSGGNHLFRLKLNNLVVSEKLGIIENDFAGLKKQIHDYCGYAMTEQVLERFKKQSESDEQTPADSTESEIALPEGENLKDPRSFIEGITGDTLLRFVCSKDNLPSKEIVDVSHLPSRDRGFLEEDEASPLEWLGNGALDEMLNVGEDSTKLLDCAMARAELVFYISSTYQSYLDDEPRVFQGEQEYILYGGDSDEKNLLRAVNGIIIFRLPFNYLYLRGSVSKLAAIRSAAVVIAVLTSTSPTMVSKALEGVVCYGESVLDVRALLRGESVALRKTDDTWKLRITDLFMNKLKGNGMAESKRGLNYEDYLMLLMIKKLDDKAMYARVLDVISLNVKKTRPGFSMKHAITKATLSYQLECEPRFSRLPKKLAKEAYIFLYNQTLEY